MNTFKETLSNFEEISERETKIAEYFFRNGFKSGFVSSLKDTIERSELYTNYDEMIEVDSQDAIPRDEQVYLMINSEERHLQKSREFINKLKIK